MFYRNELKLITFKRIFTSPLSSTRSEVRNWMQGFNSAAIMNDIEKSNEKYASEGTRSSSVSFEVLASGYRRSHKELKPTSTTIHLERVQIMEEKELAEDCVSQNNLATIKMANSMVVIKVTQKMDV